MSDPPPVSPIGGHPWQTTDDVRAAMLERFATLGTNYAKREEALAALAAVSRSLIQHTATTSTSANVIDEAAALVRQAAELLEAGPHGRTYFGTAEGSLDGGASTSFFDYSPFAGLLSPMAPPIELSLEGEHVVGRVTYERQYEGPPSCVHGGLIAAGFDELLGFAQSLSGQPGMTGRLEVRYRSPTPLFQELRYEGWVVKVDGRKILTEATLHAGDRLCAEATGLFISFRMPSSPSDD